MACLTVQLRQIGPILTRYLLRSVRYWLNFDWREALTSLPNGRRFRRLESSDKAVLVIEPNKYHAEVLPGYCHYFSQLGFAVVLLTRRANSLSGVFDLIAADERPLTFAMHPRAMKYLLRRLKPERFAFVFLTSAYWAEEYGHFGLFSRFLGQCPNGRHGFAMVVHNFEHITPDLESGEVSVSRISQLSANEYRGIRIPVINPHYFGAFEDKPLGVHRVFITVGTQYRNFRTLVEAVNRLESLGYRNFRVQVVGGGALREKYAHASERVEFLGRMPFPELYRRLAAADFYLCLLDPNSMEHQRYLNGTTTGARQLLLGFLKVPVIQEKFAKAYGFSALNAILFAENGLADGMQQALETPVPMYKQLKTRLAELREAIEAESLENLKRQVFGLSSNQAEMDPGLDMRTMPDAITPSTHELESRILRDIRHPAVSVVIPTFNRKALLPEAISSCLDQTFNDLEIIIVDDGSTDGTAELVGEMLRGVWPRERIAYVRQENRGASSARNYGLKVARGDYVQFLDSDDLLMPTKIARQICELEETQNRDAACCYCHGTMGSSMESGFPRSKIGLCTPLSPKALAKELASNIVHGLHTSAPLWRHEFLMNHASWREDISLGDDLEYHIRLLSSAEKVCFVDEELFFVREHVGPRISTGQMSAASLESLVRTRQAIYSTLEKAGLWDAPTQQAFLGAMRTIYANALQLGDHATIRDLETWLWTLADSPRRNHQFQALILLRHTLGRRFLLRAHKLLNSRRSA